MIATSRRINSRPCSRFSGTDSTTAEQRICVVDDIEGELLRESGLDVARAEHDASLVLWTRAEWRQPGRLISTRKSAQVASILKRARAAGFAGVRLAVEMTWTLNPRLPVGRLRHWEATLDTMVGPGQSVSVICQYSHRRPAPATLEAGLSTHRLAIVDGEVYDNPYIAGPSILSAEGAGSARAVGSSQLGRMISHLQLERPVAKLGPRVPASPPAESVPLDHRFEAPREESTRTEAISLISHELRTPVSTILGNAELLARLSGALPAEEQAASVRAILSEARRLSGVLDDLFVLWQEIVPRALVLEPVALRHEIERALTVHRHRYPERATEFAAARAEPTVTADRSYVAHILSNLLENAERCSPAAERILVQTALEGEYVAIRIIDQGPGIGVAERDLVFRAFDPHVASLPRASGAGLAASKRLVEAHGGRIWTQPSTRGGTEFGFTLPIASEGGRDGQ